MVHGGGRLCPQIDTYIHFTYTLIHTYIHTYIHVHSVYIHVFVRFRSATSVALMHGEVIT